MEQLTKELAKTIYKDVVETFGFVNNPINVDACYILRDGSFLDTAGGFKNHQHINIATYITKKYNIDDIDEINNGSNFMLNIMGAIRVTCWDHGESLKGIYIPRVELTGAQYDSLEFLASLLGDKLDPDAPLLLATAHGEQQIEFTKSGDISDQLIEAIEHYYYTGKLVGGDLVESKRLLEDTRNMLVSKSRTAGQYKNQLRGKNRFERKKYSKIAKTVKQYNQIDMNKFFKQDILEVKIPVVGETDEYTVSVRLEGVVAEIAKNVKNNQNKFEYRTVIQAITKIFNTGNVYVKCSCDDYKYRFAHWNIVNNVSFDDTASDPGPGKGIRNPNDDQGRGCKHILLVLANGDWVLKVASVINNYVHYAEEHLQKPFLKLIFPKIYGIPADEMVEQDLIDDDKYLDSSTGLIDAINEYGRNRGKYKPGSNKNPVTGTGGPKKKEEEEPEEEPENEDSSEE